VANLQHIVSLLGDETIAQEISIRHDMARERYQLGKVVVGSWPEFLEEIGKYYNWHYRNAIVDDGSHDPFPVEMASGLAKNVVESVYGNQGGVEAAVRNAKTGMNGGLAGVLTAIAENLKAEYEQQHIENVFNKYIDPMDYGTRVDLMQQYLDKFGAHFPPGSNMKSAQELASNYKDLIRMHAKMISSMKGKIGVS